jgi:tetratricopeptide (TPR) repeat protein
VRRFFLLPLLLIAVVAFGADPATNEKADIKQLFEQGRWPEVVKAVENTSDRSADADYYYGSALAQVGRWSDARAAFLAGQRLQPNDKRFPIELAGVEFRQKNYVLATRWLQRGLRLDPKDEYANNFLGTVYYLQGNLEAALKYWKRVGKPKLENITFDPTPRVHQALLDRAFAFSSGSTLELRDLLTSEERIHALGIFPTYDFKLGARADGNFDLAFNAQERHGFGASKLEALISTFSGAFYQAVYPSYYNLGNSAVNVVSMFRWDAQKRRAAANLSGPWHQNPKWRYTFGFDLRNENWAIHDSFSGPAPVLGALNLRREVVSTQIASLNSGRWSWSTAVELSHRDYRNVYQGTALTPSLLLSGYQVKQLAQVNYELWRVPERRFVIETHGSSELARIWSQPSHSFAKLEGRIDSQWFPQARGDDYKMQARIGVGKTLGDAPFDELFMLGLERDNDLWLRAHIGTRDGIKGTAPLGGSYFLSNWEMDKSIYSNGLIGFKLGPFLDVGKMMDSTSALATQKWLWDTGAQAKVEVLGVGVAFSYGKDLRTGNNAFYATVERSFTKSK